MTLLLKILGWIGLILVIGAYLLLIIGLAHLTGETVKELNDKEK